MLRVVQRTEPKGADGSAIVTRSNIVLLRQTVTSPRDGAEAADALRMRASERSDGANAKKKNQNCANARRNEKKARHGLSLARLWEPLRTASCDAMTSIEECH